MELDEKIFTAVGRVCVAWSELERHTFNALHVIANDGKPPYEHDASRALIAGMNLRSQWDLIDYFLSGPPSGDEEARSWFNSWRKVAERLSRERNNVVHSVWAIDGNDDEPSAVAIDSHSRKSKTQPIIDTVPGGQEKVLSIADEIEKHHMKLSLWTSQQWRRLDPRMDNGLEHEPTRHLWVKRFSLVSQEIDDTDD
jgi:hypothetical protein